MTIPYTVNDYFKVSEIGFFYSNLSISEDAPEDDYLV